ncbi:STAS domain-containing protein [Streptomyces sp. NPDC060005]|uniref:STAS domain-containing protein n=1 Tax=Streptomyces sp. NPDC060005 TaxID=3347034 RepID=UPI00367D509F
MTPPAPFDPTYLRLTTASESGDEVRLELHGFLDYDSADHFLAVATAQLADSPGLRVLHVDCAGMSGIDSTGLAMLLMLHRRTTASDVTLRLVGRPPALERMLDITGTLEHLVPDRAAEAGGRSESPYAEYRPASENGLPADSAGHGSHAVGPEISG